MTTAAAVLFCLALSYVLGSIPFGLLVARANGVDIRSAGSGNIGATNVFRTIGKSAGLLTFCCDLAKGIAAACLPLALTGRLSPDLLQFLRLTSGIVAVGGHNWPLFARFKGGKGVATGAGVLLSVAPLSVAAGLAAWGVIFIVFHIVSVASIGAAAVTAASAWPFYRHNGAWFPAVLAVLAAVIIWRHRSNIRRIIDGTENRFEFGQRKRSSAKPGGKTAGKE